MVEKACDRVKLGFFGLAVIDSLPLCLILLVDEVQNREGD